MDDSRNNDRFDQKGNLKHSFIGRPRITKNKKDKPPNQITGEIVDSQVTPVLSNTEGKSYLQIENPIHILQAQSLSLTSQYEESPQLSVERILPTPMEQQNVHQPQNARIIDEVINASNVQMETLPKFDSVAYPYSKIAGANFEAFGSELFEGLEYLLKSPSIPTSFGTPRGRQHQDGPSQEPNSNKSNYHHIPDTQPAFEVNSNFTHAQERENFENPTRPDRFAVTHSGTQVFDRNYPVNVPALAEDSSLSYEEENMMLKHFFKNLLPLLDAHPNSPWPDLALKYCDFDIARSCFISLACIHIYESRKGGNEYYKKGMLHINNTMDYLIQFISSNSDNSESKIAKVEQLQSNGILNDSVVAASTKKKLISSFVILVLINVHILFAVLEKGLSSFSRFFFKVFASVCQDEMFYSTLLENDKKQSLVVVLSWYDTVSAIVSPDFRLPYCSPDWYGSSFGESDKVSTAKMMGCPGEIFKEMAKVCLLRHELHKGLKVNREDILREYEVIKSNLLRYREYVIFETPRKTMTC